MSQQVRRADEDELSNEEIFDVLQNERRRHVLQYLREHGGPVSLGDLADNVAAAEYDCNRAEVTSAQRKRVYTTLQQSHLPQMAEVGIVEYDSDEGVITTTDQTEELTVYLEIVPEGEFPWREFYLSFGAISLAIVTVLWVGVYPFALIPTLVWATLFAVVLTLSALYHTLVAREMTLTEFVDGER
jgi:DNA-binding transcriptional ArsR family regulator